MKASYSKIKVAAFGSALAFGGIAANAGETAPKEPIAPPVAEEESLCDTIFGAAKFKFDNGFINEFAIKGRYQGQYHWTDADQGNEDSYETRRWRLGAEAKFFDKKLKLNNVWNIDGLDDDGDDVEFESIDTLFLGYTFFGDPKKGDFLTLTLGKQKPEITREYSISSSEIQTFERSAIVNLLTPDKAWGIHLGGKSDKVSYGVGAYASSFDGEYDEWFDTSGSAFFLASVGYDITGICPIGKDSADIRLDYTFTDEDGDAAPGAENVVSLNYDGTNGKFRLIWDLIAGFGDDTDVFGAILMPSYMITDNLELVGRYEFNSGDAQLYSRYERRVADRHVDTYHSVYAGLNYYICENNLKLMAGVQYVNADGADAGDSGYDGVTFLTGVRLNF